MPKNIVPSQKAAYEAATSSAAAAGARCEVNNLSASLKHTLNKLAEAEARAERISSSNDAYHRLVQDLVVVVSRAKRILNSTYTASKVSKDIGDVLDRVPEDGVVRKSWATGKVKAEHLDWM